MIIPLPDRLTVRNLESLFKNIAGSTQDIDDESNVVFDFSNCGFVSPAGAAALICYRDHYRELGLTTMARLRKSHRVFKFLQVFNLFPTETDIEDAYRQRLDGYSVGVDRCMNYSECQATQLRVMDQIVARTGCADGTRAAIDYMMTEIWDNAGVHGYRCYDTTKYPKPVYIGAFSYQTHVEVVIVDRGQGIHSSLRNNPEYRNRNSRETLQLALEEEVSGHPEGSPGFGLYSTARFVLHNNGSLSVWSSGKQLRIDENGNQRIYGSQHRLGTLVAVRLNADVDIPFEEIVGSYDSPEDYLELMLEIQEM